MISYRPSLLILSLISTACFATPDPHFGNPGNPCLASTTKTCVDQGRFGGVTASVNRATACVGSRIRFSSTPPPTTYPTLNVSVLNSDCSRRSYTEAAQLSTYYTWTLFHDGVTIGSASGPRISHQPDSPGTYWSSVRITASNAYHCVPSPVTATSPSIEIGELLSATAIDELNPHRSVTTASSDSLLVQIGDDNLFHIRLRVDTLGNSAFRSNVLYRATRYNKPPLCGDFGSTDPVIELRWIDAQIPLVIGCDRDGDRILDGDEVEVSFEFEMIYLTIGMDGNRDGLIDLTSGADSRCIFWVNDDCDVAHENEGMWQEDDVEGPPDCDDDTIGNSDYAEGFCKRDLEDFTRLHIRIGNMIANAQDATYHLSFENCVDSPSINLFEAADASSDYLWETNASNVQMAKQRLLTVDSSEAVEIPREYISLTNMLNPFLIEGRSVGSGDLTLTVRIAGDEIGRSVVHLDLKPVETFYDLYRVEVTSGTRTDVEIGIPAGQSLKRYSSAHSRERGEYIMLVHGWNMSPESKRHWANTAFKRLWWQGYQGSVGLFDWPGLYDFDSFWDIMTDRGHFDDSEFRAWLSAKYLTEFLQERNAYGEVRILAHSQGNVLTGEAIRLYEGPQIRAYIATQAAMSADFYDQGPNEAVDQSYWKIPPFYWFLSTPNVIEHFGSTDTDSRPYMVTNRSKIRRMCTYYNRDDYALRMPRWELNNVMKPDNWTPYFYSYEGSEDQYDEDGQDHFFRGTVPVEPEEVLHMTNDRERYQIFSYCAESRVKALGQLPNSLFDTNGNWNLSSSSGGMGYNDNHYSHSKQFRSNIVDQWAYWSRVMSDCSFISSYQFFHH
ncbi:MAG: hypothetical protein KJ626_06655 [Verrucomicrobia bacterium]|nr:hypothetical protein [Verrucomicrobiota bacterium]